MDHISVTATPPLTDWGNITLQINTRNPFHTFNYDEGRGPLCHRQKRREEKEEGEQFQMSLKVLVHLGGGHLQDSADKKGGTGASSLDLHSGLVGNTKELLGVNVSVMTVSLY